METNLKAPAIEFTTNMFGLLSWHLKSALYNYLEFPTQEHWNDIYCMIISSKGPMTTVWQAVLDVDPTFPRTTIHDADDNVRWATIPTPETLIKAIQRIGYKQWLNLN